MRKSDDKAKEKVDDTAAEPLWRLLKRAPKPADLRQARLRVAEVWKDPAARDNGEQTGAHLLQPAAVQALLTGIADQAPYLWQLISQVPARTAYLLETPPGAALDQCLATLRHDLSTCEGEAQAMHLLRRAKQEVALLVALCDLGGVWGLADVTLALSRFADSAVQGALEVLLRNAQLQEEADSVQQETCGLCVLALGKHGARELNYSSDIDLVVFFDPDAPALVQLPDAQRSCVRLVKGLVRLLQEPTQDGYVLRVDLRLRPDPGSTAVAVALPAALNYYETLGQNWERAAFIKARVIAGDQALGQQVLRELTPFIWRKYFDYAAIADVHAMKRQIHAVRGHAQIAVAGHDIKLGRGGIREIEFFVQTQQLIFGGRRAQLRGAQTLAMLAQLQADGWVSAQAVDDLSAAYDFLRGTEHRLQMLHDQQTQRLPQEDEALRRFARFCGFAGLPQFSKKLRHHLGRVEHHYARLFEDAPGLDSAAGNLVFTGTADDPATLQTLAGMGFQDPAKATETIRGWHFGRRAGVQSARAREVLTELVPALLQAFGGSGDPDAALAALDQSLQRMPAAVELFSLLKSNAKLRSLFADILGGAPRLAEIVVTRPHVLDVAIDPASQVGDIAGRIKQRLKIEEHLEVFLEQACGLALEQKFLIGLRVLSGQIDPPAAAHDYTDLAVAVIGATLAQVQADFVRDHGRIPHGDYAVLGMGKLGSFEMTATSDLDLVMVYDFDPSAPESEGAKPLHAVQYYTRLTHRLVAALTAPVRHGRLYDVDMRLRPSGGKGPVAVQLQGFCTYQHVEAETWEHMALTRARVVAGSGDLSRQLKTSLLQIITQPRDRMQLAHDVRTMRALIATDKGDSNSADLKLARGGLIDLEFLAQFLVLGFASAHRSIVATDTACVLAQAGKLGLLAPSDAAILVQAHALLSALTQLVRLTAGDKADPMALPAGVKARIARICGLPDFAALMADISELRTKVRKVFDRVLTTGEGAAAEPG